MLLTEKEIDEKRQGEVFSFEAEENIPLKGVRKIYIESYGCQMNFSDSEIVASIMSESGFSPTQKFDDADVILLNSCAIRDKAEQTVRRRIQGFKKLKEKKPELLVGLMGCMAERLKSQLLEEEKLVDIVVGPDAYRDLPKLVKEAETGQKAINVLLSREETYADINPLRLGSNGITAFVSIMRGCDNMCSFCVVPFTRGRERSRSAESIVNEVKDLSENGYKEVTLLGQNVDSYNWTNEETKEQVSFANLLEKTALVDPNIRVRFSTSHPKDMTDEVLHVMARYKNICDYIHLPVQSGNSRVLDLMNRTYDREWYMNRIQAIRKILPECAISTDIITGFCSETEEEHKDTLSIMQLVGYDYAYMFKYSERPKTLAERKYKDDIPEEVKKKRLEAIIELQRGLSYKSNLKDIGNEFEVLVEGISKKSADRLYGRNSQNKVIVFSKENYKPGDYVNVLVKECTSATLMGEAIKN